MLTLLECVYVLAHSLLHLGLGHFRPGWRDFEWNTARVLFIARFVAELKLRLAGRIVRHRSARGYGRESLRAVLR